LPESQFLLTGFQAGTGRSEQLQGEGLLFGCQLLQAGDPGKVAIGPRFVNGGGNTLFPQGHLVLALPDQGISLVFGLFQQDLPHQFLILGVFHSKRLVLLQQFELTNNALPLFLQLLGFLAQQLLASRNRPDELPGSRMRLPTSSRGQKQDAAVRGGPCQVASNCQEGGDGSGFIGTGSQPQHD